MQERLQLGFDALESAFRRIDEYPPHDRFAPLAETLLWIDILNTAFWKENRELYVAARQKDDEGRLIEALRYARHRLVHDVMVYGMHEVTWVGGDFSAKDFSKDFDIGTPIWLWRDPDPLAPWDGDQDAEDLYKKELRGNPVQPSLVSAAEFLRKYRKEWVSKGED